MVAQAHRPFTVKKRIVDAEGLWGTICESNGVLYKLTTRQMLTLMEVEKVPFYVDYAHADNPATLQVNHRRTKDSLVFFFRTIGDKFSKNNFNNLEAIQYNTARRPKYKRLS